MSNRAQRLVHFRIHLTHDQALRTCCHHRPPYTDHPHCRTCQLADALLTGVAAGDLSYEITFYSPTRQDRTFTGTAHTPTGRQILTRLLALAHEHPDPTTLEGWPRTS